MVIDNWKEVITETQLFYHLDSDELVMCKVKSGAAVLKKENGGYSVKINPKYGSNYNYYLGGREKVMEIYDILKELKQTFWVLPGTKYESKKPNLIDKIFDYFRK
jgi:hypothetical protein